MSGIDIIMAALGGGAVAGLTNTASTAVRDGYTGLRELVRRRLTRPGAVAVLDAHATDPGAHHDELVAELTAAGAGREPELVDAARLLLVQLGPATGHVGPTTIHVGTNVGGAVGEFNAPVTFGAPLPPSPPGAA